MPTDLRRTIQIFVVIMWILILSVCAAWYVTILPYMLANKSTSEWVFQWLLSHWMGLNLYFNYFMASFIDAGTPARIAVDPERIIPELYCYKCRQYKPERAHHCQVCKRCVMRMDHHCRLPSPI